MFSLGLKLPDDRRYEALFAPTDLQIKDLHYSSGNTAHPTSACRRTLLRPLPQPLHRHLLEMRVPDQHRAASCGYGHGGLRRQRAVDLHLPRATAGLHPDRARDQLLGAGPGGGGGPHAVLLAPAGRRHLGIMGIALGHQRQDQRQPERLLPRPLVQLSVAGLDGPADGCRVHRTRILRRPVSLGTGPALGR